MVRDELGQYVGERGLTTTCSTADKDVLALGNVLFQLFCELSGYGSHFNEVLHFEFVGVEPANV